MKTTAKFTYPALAALALQKRLRREFAQFGVRWSLRERRIYKSLERSNRSTCDRIIAIDATISLVAKHHQGLNLEPQLCAGQ